MKIIQLYILLNRLILLPITWNITEFKQVYFGLYQFSTVYNPYVYDKLELKCNLMFIKEKIAN